MKNLIRAGALFLLVLLGLLLAPPSQALRAAELLVSHRVAESSQDGRMAYDVALLQLALEKTLASHGPYRLAAAPPMNNQRTVSSAGGKDFSNFIAVLSFDPALAKAGLDYVRFPVHLGMVGYRVCFVAPGREEALKQVRSLEDLRQFTHGQGQGWADTAILRANGFTVAEATTYEALFRMVARGRFDLFCRGANEISAELRAHPDLPDLKLDRTLLIHYPLPQFFYTRRDNKALLERISKGLKLAYADGSLRELYEQHFRASIEQAELGQRRIIRLQNPATEAIDFDFHKYDYMLSPGPR